MGTLRDLKNVPMTIALLKETDMGKIVTQVKKEVKEHAEALALVTDILSEWRDMAAKETALRKRKREENAASEASSADSAEKKPKITEGSAASSSAASEATKTNGNGATSSAHTMPAVKSTLTVPPVPVRKDLVNRLAESLSKVSEAAASRITKAPLDIAILIEATVYESFKNTDDSYKTKLREINFHLKQNASLRDRVATSEVAPEKFATMSEEDMISDEQKAEAARIAQEVDDARKPPVLEANCSTERCGKCQGNRIHVKEAQTRSSDEPMTQFFTCLDCKRKWKR